MSRTAAFTESDLERARREVRELEARHDQERREADQLVADMRDSGTDPLADSDAFNRVDEAYKRADATADELHEARQRRDRIAEIVGHPFSGGDDDRGGDSGLDAARGQMASWGQRVISSDHYRALLASGVLGSSQAAINMPPVQVAGRDQLIGTVYRPRPGAQTIGDHGPLVPEDRRLMPPLLEPQREIMVIDLITVGQTDSDSVEYTRETSRTPAAGGAAFGTAFGEFDVAWERVSVPVRRRGAMHTATRGNLADQGQLRTILDSLLDEDVRLEAEDQVVGGDGQGENFTGVYETAGISNIAYDANATRFDQMHRGITAIRLARRRDPSALLVYPEDHEELILAKDGQDRYLAGVPTESDRRTVWGFPAVVSEAAEEGVPMWGRWSDATLWAREGISVSAYNQHEDYASKGLVLIVAEHRAAFVVTRASGFCTVELEDQT